MCVVRRRVVTCNLLVCIIGLLGCCCCCCGGAQPTQVGLFQQAARAFVEAAVLDRFCQVRTEAHCMTHCATCALTPCHTRSHACTHTHSLTQRIHDNFMGEDFSPAAKNVLLRLALLFGLTCVQRHTGAMLDGGYITAAASTHTSSCSATRTSTRDAVQARIMELCHQLRPDAVALVDALAPSDHVWIRWLACCAFGWVFC